MNPATMGRRLALWLGVAATAITVNACGVGNSSHVGSASGQTQASSSNATASGAGSIATTVQATTPSVDVVGSEEKLRIITIKLKGNGASNDGATATAEFSYGAPERASASTRDGLASLGSVCAFDPQTTAVEPFTLSVTNNTPRFSESPSITFNLGNADMDGPQVPSWHLYAETEYSTGPQCTDFGVSPEWGGPTTAGLSLDAPLASGAGSGAIFGFLAVDGYYSPAHPNGDPSGLQHFLIDFTGGVDSSGDQSWEIQAPDLRDESLIEPLAPGAAIK